MNCKEKYDSMLRVQVLSLPNMVKEQVNNCFTDKKLRSFIEPEKAKHIERIFISGCGDSNPVGAVLLDKFKKISGIKDCYALDPMEFSRFIKREQFGNEGSSVSIAVSARGGSSRISEMLVKAKAAGSIPALITDGRKSKAVEKAEYSFFIDTPPMANAVPGLRSYFSCLIGFIAVGCSIGIARGQMTYEDALKIGDSIIDYIRKYSRIITEAWDDLAFDVALKWKDYKRFDFIGNGRAYYSGYFDSMKFYECSGTCCCYTDPENWIESNRYFAAPDTIGTLFIIHKNQSGYEAAKHAIEIACNVGRPVIVISDADKMEFVSNIIYFPLVSTRKEDDWLYSLIDYCPGALIASAHSMMSGRKKKYYKDADGKIKTENPEHMRFLDPTLKTQHNSKCEIHM